MTPRHLSRRLARIAAFALFLCPSAALAQKTARASPEQRSSPASSATDSLIGRWELEGALGLAVPFESGVNTGFKLSGGGFFGMQTLAPGMILQLGGTVGWTYNGYESPVDGSLNTVDLLPTARLRIAVNPRVFLYGDGGLGLGIVRASITIPGLPPIPPFFAGTPSTTTTSTDAALLIKLGGGVGFDLQPNLSLVFEPAFHIYVKDGSITQFTLLAGLLYRP